MRKSGPCLIAAGYRVQRREIGLWAAIALFGFCLLTALFFHVGADQAIQLQKNVAMAGGFLALALLGPGAWSLDAWRARAG